MVAYLWWATFWKNVAVEWSPCTLFISSVGKGFLPVSLSQGFPLTWRGLLLLANLLRFAAVGGKRGVSVGTFKNGSDVGDQNRIVCFMFSHTSA